MAISPLFIGDDLDLGYTGAKNARTGAFLNSGTCTYTLKDSEGATIDSGSLDYVAASDGDYYGVIESSVTGDLEDGGEYFLTITFASGAMNDERRLALFGVYRGAT